MQADVGPASDEAMCRESERRDAIWDQVRAQQLEEQLEA